ncbi:MAG TPA: MaoC/PaaZ C-terminal domain-containing protein [Pseudomonadales bacterium]
MQFFDDLQTGVIQSCDARHTVSAEEIRDFASQWDPMPFHLDEQAASQTPVGALFASGLHTIAIGIRLSHRLMDEPVAAIAGLGWTDVRFPQPVLAGDTLSMTSELVDKRESRSKPDRGIITALNRVYNQRGELVAEYKISTLVLKRPAGD